MDGDHRGPGQDQGGAGAGSPRIALAGFDGPLDHLLTLARARQVDLAQVSLADLIDQLTGTLKQAAPATPLGQRGDWVVMAAWLVQLRSLLLLPADAPAGQAAEGEADQFRDRLRALQAMQALAGWLQRRPQLGRDAFARGQPEMFGVSADAGAAVDIIAFLWASLVLFDDDTAGPETTSVYRPPHLDLYPVTEARDRILRRLMAVPARLPLDRLLPDGLDDQDGAIRQNLRRRSAWSSTFIASLELARQGDVALEQAKDFQRIHVGKSACLVDVQERQPAENA